MTYEEMKNAVDEYFGDQSRSKKETAEGLKDLMAEIREMLDTLSD